MECYEMSEGGSSKFWTIELKGKAFTTTYGKIGAPGQTTTKSFDSADKAERECAKLVAEKVKKGYRKVGGLAKAVAEKASVAVSASVSAPRSKSKASAAPKGSIKEVLAAIEKSAALTKKQAKVDPKKFDALKKLCAVPADLETLWNWGRLPEFFAKEELKTDKSIWWLDMIWLSASAALSELKAQRELSEFPKTLLPLATDEAGNFSCLDVKTGEFVDWDHETRATRKLNVTLRGLLEKALGVFEAQRAKLDKETKQKETVSKLRANTSSGGTFAALPKKLIESPSAALRKLSSRCRGDFAIEAVSADGRFIAVMISRSHLEVIDTKKDIALVPQDPKSIESHKSSGYVLLKVKQPVMWGSMLVTDSYDAAQHWDLSSEKMAFRGAFSRHEQGNTHASLRGDWIAMRREGGKKSTVSVYQTSDFPKASSLAKPASAPKAKYTVPTMEYPPSTCYLAHVVGDGELIARDAKGALVRYNAAGKPIAKGPAFDSLDFVCNADGSRTFVDGNYSTGEKGAALDANFKKIGEFPKCEVIQVTPDGSKLIIANTKGSATTVRIVNTESLKVLAVYSIKKPDSTKFVASNVSIHFSTSTKALFFG
jgi:predicted DNA-binding WGR domain protein